MIDTGHRCDRHVGEAFPPRCYDCMAEASKPPQTPPVTYWGRCHVPGHEEYILTRSCPTCAACERAANDPSTMEGAS